MIISQAEIIQHSAAHILFVMRSGLKRLPQTMAVPLTSCGSSCHWMSCEETTWQTKRVVTHKLFGMRLDGRKKCCHSHPVCHVMKMLGRKQGSVTHMLLVIEWDVTRLSGRKKKDCHWHSLAVDHRMRDVMWWDLMVEKKAVLPTCCHGTRCDEADWLKQA